MIPSTPATGDSLNIPKLVYVRRVLVCRTKWQYHNSTTVEAEPKRRDADIANGTNVYVVMSSTTRSSLSGWCVLASSSPKGLQCDGFTGRVHRSRAREEWKFGAPIPSQCCLGHSCRHSLICALQQWLALHGWRCRYTFGMDPAWHNAENELAFYNSFKMKLSVILGVTQVLYMNVFAFLIWKLCCMPFVSPPPPALWTSQWTSLCPYLVSRVSRFPALRCIAMGYALGIRCSVGSSCEP